MRNGDVGTIYRTQEPDSWWGLLVADLLLVGAVLGAVWLVSQ